MGKRLENDPEFEVPFYENILKDSPNFIEALVALGDLYTKEGFYQKGLEVDERLAQLRPDDAVVMYNLACSLSLMDEVARAREVMMQAFALGYDDVEFLKQDPDLLNLLSDADFLQELRKVEARGSDGSKRKAEEEV